MPNRPMIRVIVVLLCACADTAVADDKQKDSLAEITSSIGMKLVRIPAGEFMMGNEASFEALRAAFPEMPRNHFNVASPSHRVRITKPFYLSVHEVTVGQFRRFVEDQKYKTEAERDSNGGYGYNVDVPRMHFNASHFMWRNSGWDQSDNHPVVNVTWNDAIAFCEWLTRKEGLSYRLPTEAEWEYACRAGAQTRYSTGDESASLEGVANVADQSNETIPGESLQRNSEFPYFTFDDRYTFSAPVGKFKPNRFGLYDMHGNVSEWCSDWFDRRYYESAPTEDPPGPARGTERVVRGGAWCHSPHYLRSAFRLRAEPKWRTDFIGFRVARSASR